MLKSSVGNQQPNQVVAFKILRPVARKVYKRYEIPGIWPRVQIHFKCLQFGSVAHNTFSVAIPCAYVLVPSNIWLSGVTCDLDSDGCWRNLGRCVLDLGVHC